MLRKKVKWLRLLLSKGELGNCEKITPESVEIKAQNVIIDFVKQSQHSPALFPISLGFFCWIQVEIMNQQNYSSVSILDVTRWL